MGLRPLFQLLLDFGAGSVPPKLQRRLVIVDDPITSGTHMYPDGYSAAVCTEWGVVPVVNPLKPSVERIGKFHSRAVPRGKLNGLLQFPGVLGVATSVRVLRYYHSQSFLRREEWELWAVRSKPRKGWTINPGFTIVSLRIYQWGVSKVRRDFNSRPRRAYLGQGVE